MTAFRDANSFSLAAFPSSIGLGSTAAGPSSPVAFSPPLSLQVSKLNASRKKTGAGWGPSSHCNGWANAKADRCSVMPQVRASRSPDKPKQGNSVGLR
jgi:hypothetical protein